MKECTIEHEARDDIDILSLSGSLDAYSFPRLEAALQALREQNRNRVILDCSGLDYISSAALGALIAFTRQVRESHGDLKLTNLSRPIFEIMKLLGFHKILEIYESPDDAIRRFTL